MPSVTSERQLYLGLASKAGENVPAVALLKLVRQGVVESGEFAYGSQYLRSHQAAAINPLHLVLQEAVYQLPPRRLRDGGALPLSLRDALPDAWGRRVLEAQHGKQLSDLDVLLSTNEDRVGALVFSQSLPIEVPVPPEALHDLDALAHAAAQLEAGNTTDRSLQRLLQVGGSLGGLRPKATFIHAGCRHIAKFPSRGDSCDMAALEAATLALARQCGIAVPPFFVQPLQRGQALLLERFDRIGLLGTETRLHYLSASAVLDVPYEGSAGSYVELAQAVRRLCTEPQAELEQLYRRLVFNLVVDNSDDHVKNHGLLRGADGQWRLAPAFDLVMQLNHLGYQALAVLSGRFDSHLDLARAAAPQFGLSAARAEDLINSVADTVHLQYGVMLDAHGADKSLRLKVRAALEKQARLIGLR